MVRPGVRFFFDYCKPTNLKHLKNRISSHRTQATLRVFGVGPARGASPRPPSSRGAQIRETRTDFRRFSAVFDGFSSKWRTKLLPFPVFSSDSNSSLSALSKISYISIRYVGEFSRYRGRFLPFREEAIYRGKISPERREIGWPNFHGSLGL